MKSVVPGVLRAPGVHLALDPQVEFMFLSNVVQELKLTPKFRMNYALPDDNHIFAGVSGPIRETKQQGERGDGEPHNVQPIWSLINAV